MEEPLCGLVVDLIGPLSPVSDKGTQYMLTIVDYTTRYPLDKIKTEHVAEALLDIICRVGFLKDVLSNKGPVCICLYVQSVD